MKLILQLTALFLVGIAVISSIILAYWFIVEYIIKFKDLGFQNPLTYIYFK
jgi:hypothetical protein